MLGTAAIIAFCSVLWVVLEGFLAYRTGMLTVAQMTAKYPGQRGVPFLYHGGMQGDIFILSLAIGWIVAKYGNSWSIPQIISMLICGMILSGFMHSLYIKGENPDSLAWKSEGITPAGWLHVVYMGAVIGLILLLYFCTPSPSRGSIIVISTLLAVHVVIGNQIPLGVFHQLKPTVWWVPELLTHQAFYTILGAWVCLVILTMIAAGVGTGLLLLACFGVVVAGVVGVVIRLH